MKRHKRISTSSTSLLLPKQKQPGGPRKEVIVQIHQRKKSLEGFFPNLKDLTLQVSGCVPAPSLMLESEILVDRDYALFIFSSPLMATCTQIQQME
jgi:hypothetical protein